MTSHEGPFVHPAGICESTRVGTGTRIWAFAHVLPGAIIGSDCNLCDSVFVENEVTLGDRVTVKCGVQLWDGVHLEDDVFIGPNATFTNDPFPRSKHYERAVARTLVRRGASIGANATILPGIVIGEGAMVGAGAVVTRSVPSFAIVTGSPAAVVGYVGADVETSDLSSTTAPHRSEEIGVGGVRSLQLPRIVDPRGDLTALEFENRSLPFPPARLFFVYGVPNGRIRGEHAHRTCHQFLVCVAGSCTVMVDDGRSRAERRLDHPSRGLYIPPKVWASQYRYSPDAVLAVVASHPYDPADYVRTYDDYLALLRADDPDSTTN